MKGSILVVDDEPIVLRSCERILGPEGYGVETSSSADEALAKLNVLNGGGYDLIITDVKMPGTDGLEFIRRVRETLPDANIVVITGYPSQESIKGALALRIIDYLPKPFSPALLLDVVKRAVEIKAKGAVGGDEYTEEVAKGLDEIIERFRGKPGSLIPVLQAAQERVGYLPPVVIRHIAKGMNLSESEVHGVVSFYSFFTMKPKGKHNVRVCLGTACYVKRAEEIMAKLKETLGIDIGEVTEDKAFSLESVRCLGACGLAPVVVVDADTFGAVNPVKAPDIINQYRGA